MKKLTARPRKYLAVGVKYKYAKTYIFTQNYTLNEEGYQLKLPLNLETIIPEDDSVRLLSQFVEAMDMQFRRYLSKGRSNVLAESTLLAMARNINKLHNKIQNGKAGTHLFPLKSAWILNFQTDF